MSIKRDEILAGFLEVGQNIGKIFADVIPADEHENTAIELMAYLNRLEAESAREEYRRIVFGALRGIGFEPTK